MKHLKLAFSLCALSLLGLGCAHTKNRVTASVEPHVYEDTAMVNVISVNRMPAAYSSIELSNPNEDVSVSTQLTKLPGETVQHGVLVFTVKDHPEVAGQIMGNSGGSAVSAQFTEVVKKIYTNGLNSKAVSVIKTAQDKFKTIAHLGAEQRSDAIKTALLETREQLLAAY